MAINLLSSTPLASNSALFENDAATGQDEGSITWGSVTREGNTYYVTIEGTDAQGGEILPTQTSTQDVNDTVNPTKVFYWVAKTLKAVICPECA